MALRIKGDTVTDAKTGKVVDRGSNHQDACRAAKERSKGGGHSVSLSPTARLAIAFDFADAETYVSKIDTGSAAAADLAAESDPAIVGELLSRKPEAVEEPRRFEVRAKQVDHDFTHDTGSFPAGSWVAIFPGGKAHAFTDGDFKSGNDWLRSEFHCAGFVLKSKSATGKTAGSSKPPTPDPKSADILAGKTKKGA